MNPKRQIIIDGLKESGFQYSKPSFFRPGINRYMVFSRAMNSDSYLVSFHDRPDYPQGLENFEADLNLARRQSLNPLPIFDDSVFFRPDRGKAEYRDSRNADRRKLLGLELIVYNLFGEVTYASDSELFVVTYDNVEACYTNAEVKGHIPKAKEHSTLATVKSVLSRTNYPVFNLGARDRKGRIISPSYKTTVGDEVRGQQLLDSHGHDEDGDLTWQELCDVNAAVMNHS
ncbi:hypothetical protein J4467_01610 [Candidatus Woesearchaeota archaeon]|nr:hypothetical protein [Candidatus Woesearchaeota archaeon]